MRKNPLEISTTICLSSGLTQHSDIQFFWGLLMRDLGTELPIFLCISQ